MSLPHLALLFLLCVGPILAASKNRLDSDERIKPVATPPTCCNAPGVQQTFSADNSQTNDLRMAFIIGAQKSGE